MDDWNLSGRADDVILVTTELVYNVTKHTDDGGELHLALHDDAILIEVTDTSPQPPRVQHPDTRSPGGRGLQLIAATARRWGTRPAAWAGRTGKVVWAELARRGFPANPESAAKAPRHVIDLFNPGRGLLTDHREPSIPPWSDCRPVSQ